ncbi:MAG TPA: tetratricopeptide repeat protein [Candidatus Paceibacterota bacterium]|nr:tetratricopeptide repeat protein [Candidatus Paceibacterota bacterium]
MDNPFVPGGRNPAPDESTGDAVLAASREDGLVSGSMYERVAQIAVYLAVVCMPLLYLPWTSSVLELNKQLALVALAGIALVVWLLGIVVSGTMRFRVSPLDKGVLALVVAVGASAIAAVSRTKALFGVNVSLSGAFITVLALAVLYLVAVNVFQDRGKMLRRALVGAGALALLLGLFQMLTVYFLPGSFTHSRAFNTVGSLNALGVLAAVLLPLFTKGTPRGWGKAGLVVSWAGVVLSLAILAILNWWILWAVALAGMLAMIGFDSVNSVQMSADYGGVSRKGRFAMSRFIVPMAVIVLGAFLLLVRFNLTAVKSQFPVEIAPSFSLSWDITRAVIGQDLLFGYGPEAYSVAFDQFGAGQLRNTQLSGLRFFDGTSEFFTMTVTGGLIAVLALAVLLWTLVQAVARFGGALSSRLGSKDGGYEAMESSGVMSATVAMTAALFLYPFNMALMGVWFALLALSALVVSGDRAYEIDIESKPAFSLSASLGFIVSLIVVLAGVYFVSVSYLADVSYARAAQAENASAALDHMARAVSLDGSRDRYFRDASQLTLQVLREEIARQDDDPQRAARVQNLVASAVQLAQRATELQPREALNWANLASVYRSMTGLVQDVEQLAEEAYARASELRPGDPTFDNQVGAMWLARADLIAQVAQSATGENRTRLAEQYDESLERAEAAFSRALEKAPAYGLAIYNRAAVYDRQGNISEAIADIERIVPANANLPSLMFELGILYLRAGRNDDALAAMQRAVLLAPQYANARWYFALLLEERGEIEAAIANLREIEKNNPDHPVLLEKISQLGAVPPVVSDEDVVDQEPLDVGNELPADAAPGTTDEGGEEAAQ